MADEQQQQPKNGNLVAWRLEQLEDQQQAVHKSLDGVRDRLTRLEKEVEVLKTMSQALEHKLDSANNWLRGVLGSLALALVLLVVNLLVKK